MTRMRSKRAFLRGFLYVLETVTLLPSRRQACLCDSETGKSLCRTMHPVENVICGCSSEDSKGVIIIGYDVGWAVTLDSDKAGPRP
jgi:hypothetical protein